MNPANHGQCRVRRNSRDERVPNRDVIIDPKEEEEEESGVGPQADAGEGQMVFAECQTPSQGSIGGQERVSRPQGSSEGQEQVPRSQEVGWGQDLVPRSQEVGGGQEQVPRPQGQSEGQEQVPRPQGSSEGHEQVLRPHAPNEDQVPTPQKWPSPAIEGTKTRRDEKVRGRSGSWSGVNESDDELEKMAQVYGEPPPDIKVSPPMRNGGSRYGSVASSLGSIGDCGQLDDSTTTNTTNGLFNQELTADRMRRRLKFFFMNPMEKWHARRRFPWKLLLQIFKIVIVTAQLCLFAQQGYNHVSYLWNTKVSFSHLFLKGWDPSREIQTYPPSAGPLAIYKKSSFFECLDFAVLAYVNIPEEAIGTYDYHQHRNGSVVPPKLCTKHYAGGRAFTLNNSYVLDDTVAKTCIDIPPSDVNVTDWSTEAYLRQQGFDIDFDLLLEASFIFALRTIKLRVNLPFDTPECYHLTGRVDFDNRNHDGQILVNMDVSACVLECTGSVEMATEARTLKVWRTIINIASISICFISLCMCVRAIYRAQILKKATVIFFHRHYNKELSLNERMEFINLWYILICINDMLIILGSLLKIGLETKLFLEEEERSYKGYLDTWNVCSVFLGLGNLLVWFGCLRYLGFFATYNVLILTIKKCIPNVLRFSTCIMMVFAGYCLCGWLVLGPYNLKFRSLSSTMECLYSLINGDDMFATFSSTAGKDLLVWWFSRIYLYTFISLFIYVILSLFIAIIMDAYETIKNYYEDGFPLSDLMKFVKECTEEPRSGVFHDVGDRTIHDIINSLCCCGQERRQSSTEYEPLLT